MKIRSKPIAQLEEEAEIDLVLRPDRVEIDSANTPTLFNKYHKEQRLVKVELINAQAAFKKLWNRKWCYYMGKSHPDVYKKKPLRLKIMKADVKQFIEADDDILTLTVTIELLELKLKYIREKMEQINSRSYHIGNMVKAQIFYAGQNP